MKREPENTELLIPADDSASDLRNDLDIKNEPEEVPEEEFTTMLCNKPPTVGQSKFMFLVLFFCVGMIQSFQSAIILDLQEKGATYEDQSNMTIALYPYIFKIFLAPLIDMFFFEKVGRCNRLMHPDHMTTIIVLWFCLNILAVFFLVAGEMWVVKALEGVDKGIGSLIFDLGFSIGGFVSYNLFVPLSSLKWLNENVFKSKPLTRPLIMASEMMWFMAAVHLAFGLWIFLMVAEKKTEHLHERMTFKRLFKMIPQLFINRHLRAVLIVIALQRSMRSLIVDSIGLKFVDYNMSKATIANTDTYSFPFIFLAGYYLNKLMLRGGLMHISFWMALYGLCCLIMRFWVLLDFMERQDQERGFWLYLTVSFFDRGFFEGSIPLGFVNMITPIEVGSTFITLFTSWSNLTQTIPQTIGFRLVGAELMEFNNLVWLVFGLSALSLAISYKMSRNLDITPLEE